jgi:hypothetical protein
VRLKNPDSDGAGSDSAMDIRHKVVGIANCKSDAKALEIRPQSPPIAGQVGLGDFARFARPQPHPIHGQVGLGDFARFARLLHLRQGGRPKITGC